MQTISEGIDRWSQSNNPLAAVSVHLARRLVQVGSRSVFSVPGDFNRTLLEQLNAQPNLNLVSCSNELNAGDAVLAHARSQGAGACVVNYTVDGLSVVDAIEVAFKENLPVICIVSCLNSNDYGTNPILHKSIGPRRFKSVTCAQVSIDELHNAHELIDHAISEALIKSKPVYISISCNLPAIPHPSPTHVPDAVACGFVDHYYNIFDSNRADMAGLYQDGSTLTFEGQKIHGTHAIVDKLTSLAQVKHNISTVDCQASVLPDGMLVFVTGSLQSASGQYKFSQMFHLIPTPAGSYYVFNDIFRSNYV